MRNIRTGQMAYDPSIAAARFAATAEDHLTEAYLDATERRPIGYALGRLLYERKPVQVTKVCMRERRFRYARVSFNYEI